MCGEVHCVSGYAQFIANHRAQAWQGNCVALCPSTGKLARRPGLRAITTQDLKMDESRTSALKGSYSHIVCTILISKIEISPNRCNILYIHNHQAIYQLSISHLVCPTPSITGPLKADTCYSSHREAPAFFGRASIFHELITCTRGLYFRSAPSFRPKFGSALYVLISIFHYYMCACESIWILWKCSTTGGECVYTVNL